jgi:anti-sigma regulatory factor (Ser/Thr protein kinase)
MIQGRKHKMQNNALLTAKSKKDQESADNPHFPEKRHSEYLIGEWTLASVAGNDLKAMELVTSSVQTLSLAENRLARLQMAVAEATRNAIEHGNQYSSDLLITLQVLICPGIVIVRIRDQGEQLRISEPADLATKLAAPQTGRGWGLYLIKRLVDHWQFRNEANGHVIELLLYHKQTKDDNRSEKKDLPLSSQIYILENNGEKT